MNELLDTLDNLKKELDSSQLVCDLKELQKKISEDKELSVLIEEYSLKPSDDIKTKILEKDLFQEYKIKETELNLLIMDMNQRLKKITKSGKCDCESH